ncbi:MAG: paraquat-inducible protein A [Pseudomonadota bacterium]
MSSEDALDHLIACPECDALFETDAETRLVCDRCHTVLINPTRRAGLKVLFLALLSVALVYGTLTQPFLSIKRFWMTSDATLLETALTFEGPLQVLSLTVLALVLLLPATRLFLSVYVLTPLVLGLSPLPAARWAHRWSEILRPWSMAEIFILGCGVALIKIVDMAEVTFGPAFWMFAALVVLLWVQDTLTCRYSLWKALDDG